MVAEQDPFFRGEQVLSGGNVALGLRDRLPGVDVQELQGLPPFFGDRLVELAPPVGKAAEKDDPGEGVIRTVAVTVDISGKTVQEGCRILPGAAGLLVIKDDPRKFIRPRQIDPEIGFLFRLTAFLAKDLAGDLIHVDHFPRKELRMQSIIDGGKVFQRALVVPVCNRLPGEGSFFRSQSFSCRQNNCFPLLCHNFQEW